VRLIRLQTKEGQSVAKKQAAPTEKKENRLVRYFREVRAEVGRVVWPTREATIRLTGIVLGVMFAMSAALGLVDWLFTRLFALIVG
jgi:preprotein translocase subunit SecE